VDAREEAWLEYPECVVFCDTLGERDERKCWKNGLLAAEAPEGTSLLVITEVDAAEADMGLVIACTCGESADIEGVDCAGTCTPKWLPKDCCTGETAAEKLPTGAALPGDERPSSSRLIPVSTGVAAPPAAAAAAAFALTACAAALLRGCIFISPAATSSLQLMQLLHKHALWQLGHSHVASMSGLAGKCVGYTRVKHPRQNFLWHALR